MSKFACIHPDTLTACVAVGNTWPVGAAILSKYKTGLLCFGYMRTPTVALQYPQEWMYTFLMSFSVQLSIKHSNETGGEQKHEHEIMASGRNS